MFSMFSFFKFKGLKDLQDFKVSEVFKFNISRFLQIVSFWTLFREDGGARGGGFRNVEKLMKPIKTLNSLKHIKIEKIKIDCYILMISMSLIINAI